ncbi:MAG: thioredoxin family protein [Gemmatimonadota bacterium]
MRSSIRLLALVPSVLLCLGFPPFFVAPAHCQTEPEYAAFYVVEEYDEARDPAVDLKVTVERAQTVGKRILLEVGGVWCGWCKLLDGFIHDHPAVSAKLDAGFLIMKVNWSRGNPNEEFLGQYPTIRGYPHIFVLEKDGTLLHSQNTGDLEEGKSYNEGALLGFLDDWMPSKGGSR